MQSSDKTLKVTSPSVAGGGYMSTNGQITFGTIATNNGTTIGTTSITVDGINSNVLSKPPEITLLLSITKGMPNIQFRERQVDGSMTSAVLEPDSSMTACDLAKIVMLIVVAREQALIYSQQLKPISYIRDHNLERHFRFAVI